MDWMGKEMTSLREEIKKIVLDAIYESVDYALEGKVYNPRITYITNEIISMIEKRIDIRLKYYNDVGIVQLSKNIEIIEELELIKEMLK